MILANPYIGPRAFRAGEELPNRERIAVELTSHLIAERIVLIHAPSGAGKTSLIQTSLADQLRGRGFQPTKALRVKFTPPDDVTVDNRYVVGLVLDLLGPEAGDPGELGNVRLQDAFGGLTAEGRPVLIIDQLEEVLTLDRTDVPVKIDFFRQLGELLEDRRLWALLAIREDYLGALDRYLRYLPGHLRSKCRLDFLQRDEAVAAIQKPAAGQGVQFTTDAAWALVDRLDVAGYVEPFQLQVACRQLWKDWRRVRGDNYLVIAHRDVRDFDFDRALSRYYAQSMTEIAKQFGIEQRLVRDWFEEALITPQRLRNQSTTGPVAGNRGREILARLESMYLVRSDERGGTEWFELSHDRLVGAVLEDNQAWQLRNLPGWQVAAYEWKRKGRARAFLYPENKLGTAPPTSAPGLLDHEKAYLEESWREVALNVDPRSKPTLANVEVEADMLTLNGVDIDTSGYLFPRLPLRELAEAARGTDLSSPFLEAMRRRSEADEARLGVSFVDDPNDLAETGWGLVYAEGTDPSILDALEPLRELRMRQAGERYRELAVQAGESTDIFLARNGMGPGPADPRKVPYYLLIVGPPQTVSFAFQYQLDVEYAVGRADFETAAEYAAYAAAVVAADERDRCKPAVHVFGTRNAGDLATALSASRLAEPLAKELVGLAPGMEVTVDVGGSATKARLTELLAEGPQVLFTATHGLGRESGTAREIQGALVCQDWPGPIAVRGPIAESQYLAATDITGALAPRVVFSFACYSAGTPGESFVARLPQKMLTSGVLGFVGHVDKAWSFSFRWKGNEPQITAMVDAVLKLHKGHRLGHAMESVNSRWAAIATQLIVTLDEMRVDGRIVDDRTLAWLWTASSDARNYVVLGDPAVRAW